MWELLTHPVVVCALAGLLGQLGRILMGVKKAIDNKEEISGKRMIVTALIGMGIGALTGALAEDWRLAFLTGFAGTDSLESIQNILSK